MQPLKCNLLLAWKKLRIHWLENGRVSSLDLSDLESRFTIYQCMKIDAFTLKNVQSSLLQLKRL